MVVLARQLLIFCAGYLALSVILSVGLLIFGFWPKTLIGWLVLLGAAVPVTFVFEGVGRVLFHDKLSRALDPDETQVSPSRIAYALVAMIAYLAAILWLVWPIRGFLDKHFL